MPHTASQPFSTDDLDGHPRLTREGVERLAARLAEIHDRLIPAVRPLLTERERDERHVAEFERLIEESLALETLLGSHRPIDGADAAPDGRVTLGARVLIADPDGTRWWVRPVHPAESALDNERVSATSPLALAVLGARAGHTVWVSAPSGLWACEILEVHPLGT